MSREIPDCFHKIPSHGDEMRNLLFCFPAALVLWGTCIQAQCVEFDDFENGVLVEQTAAPNQLIYRREAIGMVLDLPTGVEADAGSIVQSMIIGHPLMLTEVRFNDGTLQSTDILRDGGDWATLPDTGEWLAFVNFIARNGEETDGHIAFYFAQHGEQVVGDCTYETWVIDVSARYDDPTGNSEYRIHFAPELEFPIRIETRNTAGRFEDLQQITSLQIIR